MRLAWQSRLRQVPLESWTFVVVGNEPFGLFLSLRPDTFWRGFVLAKARRNDDLLQVRWSPDLLEQHLCQYREEQLGDAQQQMVAILAARLCVDVALVQAARNGRPVEPERRVSDAQVHQVARLQPRR